jgi:hypothetical protein
MPSADSGLRIGTSFRAGTVEHGPQMTDSSPEQVCTVHASCTRTQTGTLRGTLSTVPGRSLSQAGRNPDTATPARRRSPARSRAAPRSVPPTAPHVLVQRIEKAVQGRRARVSRPVKPSRLCGGDDAARLPQRGGTSPACPHIARRRGVPPHLPAWGMRSEAPDPPQSRRILSFQALQNDTCGSEAFKDCTTPRASC